MVTEKSSDEKPEKREPTVKISQTAESDLFWIEYGRKTLTETIEVMDERLKFMVTTCSSLIIIDFSYFYLRLTLQEFPLKWHLPSFL